MPLVKNKCMNKLSSQSISQKEKSIMFMCILHSQSWHSAVWLVNTKNLNTAGSSSTAMIPDLTATKILHSATQLIVDLSLFLCMTPVRLSRKQCFMIFFSFFCIIFWWLYIYDIWWYIMLLYAWLYRCIFKCFYKFILLVSVGKASFHMQFGQPARILIMSWRLYYENTRLLYMETASGSTRHCCLRCELLKEQRQMKRDK